MYVYIPVNFLFMFSITITSLMSISGQEVVASSKSVQPQEIDENEIFFLEFIFSITIIFPSAFSSVSRDSNKVKKF